MLSLPRSKSPYTISRSVPLTLFPMTLSLPTNQSHQNILKFTATLISGDSHCQLHLYHCQLLLCPYKPETLNHSGLRRHPSPISLIVSSTSAIIGYLCPPILGLTTQIHLFFFQPDHTPSLTPLPIHLSSITLILPPSLSTHPSVLKFGFFNHCGLFG